MNPIDPTQRKDLGDGLFRTKNLIKNLAIYSGVGALGTAIALMTVLLPYPILYVFKKSSEHFECNASLYSRMYCV
jgi:hypothetical protein